MNFMRLFLASLDCLAERQTQTYSHYRDITIHFRSLYFLSSVVLAQEAPRRSTSRLTGSLVPCSSRSSVFRQDTCFGSAVWQLCHQRKRVIEKQRKSTLSTNTVEKCSIRADYLPFTLWEELQHFPPRNACQQSQSWNTLPVPAELNLQAIFCELRQN